MELKLEVALLPVADVDRTLDFYRRLDFRLDADLIVDDSYRVVQLTPPGSTASIIFGTGVTTSPAGSNDGLLLAVWDIEETRAEIAARGIEISEVFHEAEAFIHPGTERRIAGPHPERADYGSYATFADPDGNLWILQEIKKRLPGR
ncbi:VOC family protein [Agromyces aurantiacus]|uniref:VOC family protein n=1 Tax=Agromyces aurantiacus TaxID=165814 RepID=A0ABV9RCD4_9MICO|nr:VOC family protein [Agromyces aurantiacus]MBM7505108.1 catechol 2,3-dioxygenase-like lactoylglutathione lyase family enzyme [Agromyces aurantiacus]